jgi:haloalkane dehalogenase
VTNLHHVDEGDGPVVLFVHGNPSSSRLHRKVIARLRGTHRCVAPDLPGFGESAVPRGFGWTPSEHADALERFVLDLDLRGITLMCQDWGGPIGFAVAGRHPERFDGFVVGNTWAWPMNRRGTGLWSAWFSGPIGSRAMQRLGAWKWNPPGRPELDAVKGLAAGVDRSNRFLSEVERGLERLRDKRAVIVWPDRDPVFGPTELRRWREQWPDAEVVTLRGASHFIQEDAPAEIASATRSLS